MALVHEFAIVDKSDIVSNIDSSMKSIKVSDVLISYISDSLRWINSVWNGKGCKDGLCYHGYSIIKDEEINKLMNIIEQWKSLFYYSTEEFYLTGDYLPEEEKYEKIELEKQVVIQELDLLIYICREAMLKGKYLLHNGI